MSVELASTVAGHEDSRGQIWLQVKAEGMVESFDSKNRGYVPKHEYYSVC